MDSLQINTISPPVIAARQRAEYIARLAAVESAKQQVVRGTSLPGPYLSTAEQARRKTGIVGVHLVVHTRFGPPSGEFYETPNPFASPFQTDIAPYPSKWNPNGLDSLYVNGASTNAKGVPLADMATRGLTEWYFDSVRDMVAAEQDLGHPFDRHCFTMDMDPAFILPNDGQVFAQDAQGRFIVPQKGSAFDLAAGKIQTMIRQNYLANYDATAKNILSKMVQGVDYSFVPSAQKSILLEPEVMNNPEQVKSIISFNGFLASINGFMMGRFLHYATFANENALPKNYQQHVFVEVIGFTSASDFSKSDGSEMAYAQSRLHAWDRWLKMRTEQLENDSMPIRVPGAYMVQQMPMPPMYTADGRAAQATSAWFDRNVIFSEIQPVYALPEHFYIPAIGEPRFLSTSQLWDRVLSEGNTARLKQDFFALKKLTKLPLYLSENAFAAADAPVALADDLYFDKQEFLWRALDGSFKELGAGAYGNVVKIRWHAQGRVTIDGMRINRRSIFKHSYMMLVLLTEHREIVQDYEWLYQNAGPQLAAQKYAGYVPAVPSLTATILNANTNDYEKVAFDFTNLATTTVAQVDAALLVVKQSIRLDAGVQNNNAENPLAPNVVAYESEARVNLSLKLGTRTFDANYEFWLPYMLTLPKYAPDTFGIVYDPFDKESYYTNRMPVPRLGKKNLEGEAVLAEFGVIGRKKSLVLHYVEKPSETVVEKNEPGPISSLFAAFFGDASKVPDEAPNVMHTLNGFPLASLRLSSSVGIDTALKPRHPSIGMPFMTHPMGMGSDGGIIYHVIPLQAGSLTKMLSEPFHFQRIESAEEVAARSAHGRAQFDQLKTQLLKQKLAEFDGTAEGKRRFFELLAEKLTSGPATSYTRPLSLFEYVRIQLDVCRALIWIHANGVAHTDIKQDNVLVSARRRGILSDFGLSRPYGVTNFGRSGTPGYYPAELATPLFAPIDTVPDEIAFGKMLRLDETHYFWFYRIGAEQFYSRPLPASHVGCSLNKRMILKVLDNIVNEEGAGNPFPVDKVLLLSNTTTLYWNDDNTASDINVRIPISQAPVTSRCASAVLRDLASLSQFLTAIDPANPNDNKTHLEQMVTESETLAPTERTVFDGDRLLQQYGISKLRFAEAVFLLLLKSIRADVFQYWGQDSLVDEIVE